MVALISGRLITIPFSHYCEKARWTLDRAGVAFVEDAHLPFFSRRPTRKVGAGRTTPVLVLHDGRVLADSTDILRFVDAERGTALLTDPDAAGLEARFDDQLGPHSRRLGYFHMLKDMGSLRRLVDRAPVPTLERLVGRNSLPAFRILLKRGLNITPQSAQRSEAKVQACFTEVEERLKDGRAYLCGDRFTAADLTFAALAAPLVLSDAYARTLLPFEQLGDDSKRVVERMRTTAAGKFALRLYANERAALVAG